MYAAVPQQKDMFVPTRHLCSKRKELDLHGTDPQLNRFENIGTDPKMYSRLSLGMSRGWIWNLD